MTLQNRVTPFGELVAVKARGTMFGNRGGRIHTDARTLTTRRWASRQWICCVLDFKGRQRDVWGRFYTELFFLDEVTALAAGHRPCFECRRRDAARFAKAFAPRGKRISAPEMDVILHRERLDGRDKRLHARAVDALPDGATIVRDGEAFALRGRQMLRWTPEGYRDAVRRPRSVEVDVLTPPSVLRALANGYAPAWHKSANRD
ncbi:MAG: hypothetical protein AB7T86_08880 [Xanthobacteraceae bacterium]|uniref:hypothetical protein n=1 Tax=Pseudolabrys sp. TaxID=1960880 RepID=UPI003D0D890A